MSSTKVFLRRRLALALSIVIVLGLGAIIAKDSVRAWYEVSSGADFAGPGSGETVVTVLPGETGEEIAKALVESGVTATFTPTYRALLAADGLFYPGDYRLKKGMNSMAAVEALLDGGNRIETRALIKEGYRASQIFQVLSETYGVPLSEFEAVKPSDLGLPRQAINLDGYLFPATYSFSSGDTALSMLKAMWQRMQQELETLGVPDSKYHEILNMAALVQREGRSSSQFSKMARTFYNRLDVGMLLQSDATVSYALGTSTYLTSAEQRANDNPWNTYKYVGLPRGPISAPGADAIRAAIDPEPGPWIFFCTVNLETGETEFNETLSGHERSVSKLRSWLRANPGWE
jgi:UPF0755 protein